MKRPLLFTLLFTLLLTSCAPVANVAKDTVNRVGRGDDSATLETVRESAGYVSVTFRAGDSNAEDVTVFLGGADLKVDEVNGPLCKAVRSGLGCEIGKPGEKRVIPASTHYTIYVSGSGVTSSARYYRPGRDKPLLIVQ